MNDKDFILFLERANEDVESALYGIIQNYEGLIIKNSFVNGRYDEDCRAYIESVLVPAIRNFKKNK